jgi:hypothetical protein
LTILKERPLKITRSWPWFDHTWSSFIYQFCSYTPYVWWFLDVFMSHVAIIACELFRTPRCPGFLKQHLFSSSVSSTAGGCSSVSCAQVVVGMSFAVVRP